MAFYRRETSSFQINSNLNQISIRTFSIYENSSVDQIRMSVNIQQRSSLVLTNRSQERERHLRQLEMILTRTRSRRIKMMKPIGVSNNNF